MYSSTLYCLINRISDAIDFAYIVHNVGQAHVCAHQGFDCIMLLKHCIAIPLLNKRINTLVFMASSSCSLGY